MEQSRRRIRALIISVSLLVHLLALIFFLILYEAPASHNFLMSFDTADIPHIPETIFYNQPNASSETAPDDQHNNTQEDTEWAALKPRASTLAASMEMPYEEIGPEQDAAPQDISFDDSAVFEDQPTQTANEADTSRMVEGIKGEEIIPGPSTIVVTKEGPAAAHKKAAQIKKAKAQRAIASITRGYLEQLTNEGTDLIKTIGGDPNKRPTAQQLKHERYLAKIQWCLQNSHNINKEKCLTAEPIHATMKVYFALKKNGAMESLQILQSSGNPFVDNYIKTLFEHASSSFPPVPSYITEEPYKLLYHVLVNWNVSQPYNMGFYRE